MNKSIMSSSYFSSQIKNEIKASNIKEEVLDLWSTSFSYEDFVNSLYEAFPNHEVSRKILKGDYMTEKRILNDSSVFDIPLNSQKLVIDIDNVFLRINLSEKKKKLKIKVIDGGTIPHLDITFEHLFHMNCEFYLCNNTEKLVRGIAEVNLYRGQLDTIVIELLEGTIEEV